MTANQRIILNVAATYGRSLFSLMCGVFTGRWALMALGQTDYGLNGVIAGLAGFITFFNGILAGAIGRFYAFSVGESQKEGNELEGLDSCRKWFNTAVCIHALLPILLICIGYPIGVWAVKSWLTIPPDRVAACIWVFRFVCVTCFVGMVNVPFNAMYIAKQRIAELTIYSLVSTVSNVVLVWYMVNHPGDWLARYAMGVCLIAIVPQAFVCIRAIFVFPECKFVADYLFSASRIRKLVGFAGWQLFGNLGYLVKGQGIALLVNKLFGPIKNASMAVATTVTAQTDTLAASMNAAFSPAITNLAGADEKERMMRMTYRSCKFGGILSLFFVLPLSLEIHAVLNLWLKNPPPLAAEVCLLTLAAVAVDETARGIGIAVTAYGRIAIYYVLLGSLNIFSLPIAWFAVWVGWGGFLTIFAVLLIVRLVAVMISAYLGQRILGLSFPYWLKEIFGKLAIVASVALGFGWIVKWLLSDFYFVRVFSVFAVETLVFCLMVWEVALDKSERIYFASHVAEKLRLRK